MATPGRVAGSGRVDQWPSYLAFVAAFAVLGLIWLSHHALFSRLRGANASLLLRNLLLLFLAALFSFPTALLPLVNIVFCRRAQLVPSNRTGASAQ